MLNIDMAIIINHTYNFNRYDPSKCHVELFDDFHYRKSDKIQIISNGLIISVPKCCWTWDSKEFSSSFSISLPSRVRLHHTLHSREYSNETCSGLLSYFGVFAFEFHWKVINHLKWKLDKYLIGKFVKCWSLNNWSFLYSG